MTKYDKHDVIYGRPLKLILFLWDLSLYRASLDMIGNQGYI